MSKLREAPNGLTYRESAFELRAYLTREAKAGKFVNYIDAASGAVGEDREVLRQIAELIYDRPEDEIDALNAPASDFMDAYVEREKQGARFLIQSHSTPIKEAKFDDTREALAAARTMADETGAAVDLYDSDYTSKTLGEPVMVVHPKPQQLQA